MADQLPQPKTRKWYKKKRYLLAAGFVGLIIGVAIFSSPPSATSSAVQTSNSPIIVSSPALTPQVEGASITAQPVTTPPISKPVVTQTTAPTPIATQPRTSTPDTQTFAPEIQQPAPTTESEPPTPVATSPVNYYTNSDNNQVQSPTSYTSAPPGATAECQDTTYSFSQSRRGTCSHHGGVSEWLGN